MFLDWARPVAPVVALAVFGVLYLASPSDRVARIMVPLAASVAAAALYVLASRRWSTVAVLRVALVVDTLLIAAMTAALEQPDEYALAYFWSPALAAFLLGSRETALNTLVAATCAAVVPYATPYPVDLVTVVTGVLVIALIGGLMTFLSAQGTRAAEELRREREQDAAALRISERVRSTTGLADVIHHTVEELGAAVGVARCVVRLARQPDGSTPAFGWQRPGLEPFDLPEPPDHVRRVFETGERLVVEDVQAAGEELRAFGARIDARSVCVYPIVWRERVVATLGFSDDRPRRWRDEVTPLLDRLVPQLAAAIAQAEVFDEQRAALERIEELTRLREDLVANVSHELRTPLTSTIGFLRTLERDDIEISDEDRARYLTIARNEAERLSRLVDDLLELARLGRRTVRMNLAQITVTDLVARSLQGLDLDGRTVDVRVPDDLVVTADADRMLQVMTNLLRNSIEHGAGTVAVLGHDEGARATIVVTDEGPGIPPDQAAGLFVPFSRWSESPNSTGLGLAISRGIVEAHGGTLRYRSRAGGQPQGFVVTMPKRAAAPGVGAP